MSESSGGQIGDGYFDRPTGTKFKRVPDEQMTTAPLTHGANVTYSKLAFHLDFLVPDESGAAEWLVARRVLVDPTAMPGLINAINLQWNEYEMTFGAQIPPAEGTDG